MSARSLSAAMPRLAMLGVVLAIAACTAPAEGSSGDATTARQAAYPQLLPLDRTLWAQAGAEDPGAEVAARVARLRARAVALQAADL